MHNLGIIGMGTMGKNLSLNFANKGFKLFLFNRHVPNKEVDVAKNFINQFQLQNTASGFDHLESFIRALPTPRIILILLPAGEATSSLLESIIPLLHPGDILMDGGNAHYKDTEKRIPQFQSAGIEFLGVGISGGESGARNGPAIMPGGNPTAYQKVAQILETVAAQNYKGKPCCKYTGKGGSGHFVKMVHNGIEYAEMQLIAEVYSIMRNEFLLSPEAIAEVLESWNQSDFQSYLLKITCDILRYSENGILILDTISDQADQKGTGSWTTIAACELGVPVPTLTAALNARLISCYKRSRVAADLVYKPFFSSNSETTLTVLRKVYSVSRLINHIQGFHLIETASKHYRWEIQTADVAATWTNGCIIQSGLMQEFAEIIHENTPYITSPEITQRLQQVIPEFGQFLSAIIPGHLPLPCMESAWTYLKSFAQAESSANLIQAQRDYFGAHTYRRKDDPDGPAVHTYWQKNTF
jgi:6-phosphogluconate dehydrogenase